MHLLETWKENRSENWWGHKWVHLSEKWKENSTGNFEGRESVHFLEKWKGNSKGNLLGKRLGKMTAYSEVHRWDYRLGILKVGKFEG